MAKINLRFRAKKILNGEDISFKENFTIRGSVEWTVDLYIPKYNVAIICCEKMDYLWEKLAICQDITKHAGTSCIMIINQFKIPLKAMQLALSNDIIIMDLKNLQILPKILEGEEDLEKYNYTTEILEGKASRKMVLECEERIMEMLDHTPLTNNEIIEALKNHYPERTIKWCISKLKRTGKITVLARMSGDGKAIYSTKPEHIQIAINKYPLSKTWKRNIYSHMIIKALKESKTGLTTAEISIKTNLKIPQIIAITKHLELRGIIERRIIDDHGRIVWGLKNEKLNIQ